MAALLLVAEQNLGENLMIVMILKVMTPIMIVLMIVIMVNMFSLRNGG